MVLKILIVNKCIKKFHSTYSHSIPNYHLIKSNNFKIVCFFKEGGQFVTSPSVLLARICYRSPSKSIHIKNVFSLGINLAAGHIISYHRVSIRLWREGNIF